MTTMAQAIHWQAAGQDETLDARLASGRGTSKVHALVVPRAWDGMYDPFTRATLACGRKSPHTEEVCGLWPHYSLNDVTCKRCRKRIGREMTVPHDEEVPE